MGERSRIHAALVALGVACQGASALAQPPGSEARAAEGLAPVTIQPEKSAGPTPPGSLDPPRLYLSCPETCFEDYLKQRLSYFDFVRDPYLSDYTLVIVRQPAGSGGERFSLTIEKTGPKSAANGQSKPAPSTCTTKPGASTDDARRELLALVLRSLLVELADTEHAAEFAVSLAERTQTQLGAVEDPWNFWVIVPSMNAWGEGASGFYGVYVIGALTVRRITETSKLRLKGSYARDLSGYRLEDGERVSGDVYGSYGGALYAHSLGKHWALGATTTAKGDEYANLEVHVHGGPLLEYNVAPYSDNASRQLRFAYQIGAWANWYLEESVNGAMEEVRPYHALSVIADLNRPWGSLQCVAQFNSFIDEPELFRLSGGLNVAIRLARGLAVDLNGNASWVRDQINLRGRTITNLELLLGTAEQPTDFQVNGSVGLSYTFGSVHNTIVNPRFGRVDLDEE